MREIAVNALTEYTYMCLGYTCHFLLEINTVIRPRVTSRSIEESFSGLIFNFSFKIPYKQILNSFHLLHSFRPENIGRELVNQHL